MSATKRQYQSMLNDHRKRRERNIRLLARLDNIEKKAAFLQAKTDRIKSLKVIYKNQVQSPPVIYSDIPHPTFAPKTSCILTEKVLLSPNTNGYDYYRPPHQYPQYRNERVYIDPNPLYTYKNITLDDAIEEISRRFILVPKNTKAKEGQSQNMGEDIPHQPKQEDSNFDRPYENTKSNTDYYRINRNQDTFDFRDPNLKTNDFSSRDSTQPLAVDNYDSNSTNETSKTDYNVNNINCEEKGSLDASKAEILESDITNKEKSLFVKDAAIENNTEQNISENQEPPVFNQQIIGDFQKDQSVSKPIDLQDHVIQPDTVDQEPAVTGGNDNIIIDTANINQPDETHESNVLSYNYTNDGMQETFKQNPDNQYHPDAVYEGAYAELNDNINPLSTNENASFVQDSSAVDPTYNYVENQGIDETGETLNNELSYKEQHDIVNSTVEEYNTIDNNYENPTGDGNLLSVQAEEQDHQNQNYVDNDQQHQQELDPSHQEYDPNQQYYEGEENGQVDPNQQYEYNQDYENQGIEQGHPQDSVDHNNIYAEDSQVYNSNGENAYYNQGDAPQEEFNTDNINPNLETSDPTYNETQSYGEAGNENQYESENIPYNENYEQQETTYDDTTLGDQVNDLAEDEQAAQPLKILESDTEHEISNREEQSKQESDFDFSVAQ